MKKKLPFTSTRKQNNFHFKPKVFFDTLFEQKAATIPRKFKVCIFIYSKIALDLHQEVTIIYIAKISTLKSPLNHT